MDGQSEEDRMVLRIGGVVAVVGALLGLVGNLIHPVTPIDDIEGVARVIGDSEIWVPVHLVIVLGIVLMLGGLVAIGRSIRGALAGALARFGYAAAVLGAAIGLILVILDGVAARQLAQEWASASTESRDIALGLVHANETINFALASLFNFVFAAVTFILFGLAVALSGLYPRWLGLVAAGAGALSLVAGTIQASVGEPTDASRVLTIIGPTIITLWLLVMGVLVLRKAGAVPVRSVVVEAGGGGERS
jgi:ABC-type multidrug transport system fused ATPase/permease subunit